MDLLTPTLLFDVLGRSEQLTEELWHLQLVSWDFWTLYRRNVRYRNESLRVAMVYFNLKMFERLSHWRSENLLLGMMGGACGKCVAPLIAEDFMRDPARVNGLIESGVFRQYNDEVFKTICLTQNVVPSTYTMCLLAIRQHACTENYMGKESNSWFKTSLAFHMERANRYHS